MLRAISCHPSAHPDRDPRHRQVGAVLVDQLQGQDRRLHHQVEPEPEDRERGEKLGANRYLVKSQVTLEDVVAVVHEVLEDGGGAASPVGIPNADDASAP